MIHQQTLGSIVARKHIPVETTISININRPVRQKQTRISRTINPDILGNIDREKIINTIRYSSLDEAISMMEKQILETVHPQTRQNRRGKIWFNQEYYKARKQAIIALKEARIAQTETRLKAYNIKRREYKEVIRKTKEAFQIAQEQRMVEEAEQNWYKAVTPRQPHFPKDIPMDTWVNHFNEVLKDRETRPIPEPSEACIIPFTTDEVMQALSTVKPNKACGPDMLYNEHLKDTAEHLKTAWTAFYNKCLEEGQIPENWRLATLKGLYKGKGNASDPQSYRGIALEC